MVAQKTVSSAPNLQQVNQTNHQKISLYNQKFKSMDLLLVHTIILISCLYRFCKWCLCRQTDGGRNNYTDAMMMRWPAPLEPPMMAMIKLGTMAILRVIRFLSHCFILMSKKPWAKSQRHANRASSTCMINCRFSTWNVMPKHNNFCTSVM